VMAIGAFADDERARQRWYGRALGAELGVVVTVP